MKILNKFIWSKTEPKNKNDIWFDGSVFNLYRNDTWEAFTLPIDAAEKVAEVIKDALNVFQSKLIAGKGINIKDSVISTTTLFNIVNNLPLEGKEDTIYLVLNSEQDTNRFKEYVWINNTWESLGEFKADVDLSNYITKQVFNSALTDKADRSELTKLSAEVSGLSEGIALRNVGAEDTDESVDEPSIPSGGGTPSGDPMHYMFEAVGATYNATDADIPMVGVYGDSYVHKAKHWHLNELGDITNEEMRQIYAESQPMVRRIYLENAFSGSTIRTNIPIWDANRSTSHGSIALTNNELRGGFYESKLEVFAFIIGPMSNNIQKHLRFSASALNHAFRNASKLSKIIGCLNCSSATDYQTFMGTTSLKEVRLIRLKNSFSFSDSPLLSKDSVLFAIQNSEATSAITITLHADAYARLAEDADIVAALAEKEFVSLASA